MNYYCKHSLISGHSLNLFDLIELIGEKRHPISVKYRNMVPVPVLRTICCERIAYIMAFKYYSKCYLHLMITRVEWIWTVRNHSSQWILNLRPQTGRRLAWSNSTFKLEFKHIPVVPKNLAFPRKCSAVFIMHFCTPFACEIKKLN